MNIELSALKSDSENIGKHIKISKKLYKWEFIAHFKKDNSNNAPQEPMHPEVAKYAGQKLCFKVELKDSA